MARNDLVRFVTSLTREGTSLAEMRRQAKIQQAMTSTLLLLDVSGSMDEGIGGVRKIDRLRESVRDVIDRFPSLPVYVFSHSCYRVQPNSIPEPQTDTNLPEAFRVVGYRKHIILVSDGLPQEPEASIQEAVSRRHRVDIIYIGPGDDIGEAFMRRLAQATGGREFTISTAEFLRAGSKELARKIAGFLPAGR